MDTKIQELKDLQKEITDAYNHYASEHKKIEANLKELEDLLSDNSKSKEIVKFINHYFVFKKDIKEVVDGMISEPNSHFKDSNMALRELLTLLKIK